MPLIKCPDCGREVSDSAPTCPGCGRVIAVTQAPAAPAAPAPEPKKMGVVGKLGVGCLGIVALFMVIGVIGSLGDGDKAPAERKPRRAESPTASAPPPATPAKAKGAHKVGDSFRLGDFTYAITKVTKGQAVGNEFVNEQASPGATFLFVHFAIRNEGQSTATVMTDDFVVVDGKGRRFRPSSNANTAYAMSSGKDLLLTELQPGIQRDSLTIFEVPEDALAPGLAVDIPEKGLFGSGKVTVSLM